MLNIRELLELRGLDSGARAKLVRHQDPLYDMEELCRKGLIAIYQSYQHRTVFECEYVISFIGIGNSRARLYGVYRVKQRMSALDRPLPPDFEFQSFATLDGYHYEMEEVPGFEDLNGRVIIDWGKGALSWCQWPSAKEVVEMGAYRKP